jgi:RNA-binding protein YlmH
MVVFMSDSIRLAKRVAELFHCSRGEATLYIESAAVQLTALLSKNPAIG